MPIGCGDRQQCLRKRSSKGLVSSNPAKDAMRPKSRKQKPFSPAADDVRFLFALVKKNDPEVGTGAALLIATGMRRGELLALLWSDINWAHEQLHVNKSPRRATGRRADTSTRWSGRRRTTASERSSAYDRRIVHSGDPPPGAGEVTLGSRVSTRRFEHVRLVCAPCTIDSAGR